MRKVFSLMSICFLVACGGGGGDAADPVGVSVDLAGATWGNCTVSVDGAPSRHVIIGGQSPYEIRSLSMNLIVGTMNNNVFTPSANGQFGMASPLLISNSGSSVWVVTDQMPCDSEGVVQVMDADNIVARITINTEAAE